MANGSLTAFQPTGTATLTAGTSSTSAVLVGGGDSVVVTNTSAALAYVRFGADHTVAATSADMPVLAGTRVILGINGLISNAAAVLASGSGNVLFTRGNGAFV